MAIINPSKYWRVSSIAKKLGYGRSTLFAAVDRGEIPYIETACGLRLITARDAKKWAASERKPGRKPVG